MLMDFQDILAAEERLRELRNHIWRHPDCKKHGRNGLKVCGDCQTVYCTKCPHNYQCHCQNDE
jgi:hypothetical protein